MSSTNYRPSNLLVTGGAGFIGSHFIRHCLQTSDVKIINLDSLTYAGSLTNLHDVMNNERHIFVRGDIVDQALVENLLREYNIDTIVHFAAESHVDRSIQGPEIFLHTNVLGTYRLLEAARKVWLQEKSWQSQQCRFHHISTDEVYGSLSALAPAFTEASPYAPNSPYSASKASSDHWVRAYFHTFNLPVTLSHCSNNYGPYQHNEKLIPTIIRSCLTEQPIPLYGDGSNIRDWIYVEDHVQGVLEVIKNGRIGETYHVGGECEVSNVKLAQTLCTLMDELYPHAHSYSQLIQFVTDRPGHDWRYAMNISKINQELKWYPRETLNQGLRKTIEFYAGNHKVRSSKTVKEEVSV